MVCQFAGSNQSIAKSRGTAQSILFPRDSRSGYLNWVFDLHGHNIDHITIQTDSGHVLRRVDDIVNRIQKLRKKVALEPTDMVEVYFESLDEDKSVSQRVLHSQESYIRDAIGSEFLPYSLMPAHAVVLGDERFHGISSMSFGITLARPAVMFNSKAILSLFKGDMKFVHNLQTYLLSRDHSNLKFEFQDGNGKKIVDSIEQQPVVEVVLGEHVFLTVGDFYLAGKAD